MKKNTAKKKPNQNGFTLINFKVKDGEHRQLIANAKAATKGNVSAWVRKVACRKWKFKSPSKAA